uniref:Uncharacterized protein n=1 Tax=viral metagenome TaxID=1070528 RepID=A0A6H1ZYS0_9ZZZZ
MSGRPKGLKGKTPNGGQAELVGKPEISASHYFMKRHGNLWPQVVSKENLELAFKIRGSKFGEKTKSGKCLTLQFELEGQRRVLFTGSEVLLEQTEKYERRIPFLATIKKIDRYYTFT